jgi:hypothetical protein
MRSTICLVVATFAVWLSMQGPAAACSCLPPDMNRSYDNADQVLHVRVLGSLGAAAGQRRYLAVTIKQAFKGCLGDASLVAIQTASDSAACGMSLQAGKEYLLHGKNNGSILGVPVLRVGLCDANSEWSALETAHLDFLNTRYNCCGDKCGCVGSQQVECFVDPCQVSTCDVEGATCNANYCGGCNAEWTDATGARVCLPKPATCDNPVQCLVDPCQVSSCDVKGATCTADYCGGCNAIWTDPNGTRVCQPEQTCENPVQCLVDPCQVSTCDVKGATCTANYCGGCNAVWTDPNGTRVCQPLPPGCDDPNRSYVGTSPEQCATIRFVCVKGQEAFSDACGCGCKPVRPPVDPACKIGGCSGQLCIGPNDSGISTCIWRDEYACYRTATCEPQARGRCGWTQTPELNACIAAAQQ